jgi:UDP-glucose 4-epimerase
LKIIIIGSKGFIGSNLSNHLRPKKEYLVYGADVLVDYESKNYFLIDQSNADFEDIFNKQNFDICINCSGAASVPDSVTNPQRYFKRIQFIR